MAAATVAAAVAAAAAAGLQHRAELRDAPLLHAVLHEDGPRRLRHAGQCGHVARPRAHHHAKGREGARVRREVELVLEMRAVLLARRPILRAHVEHQRVRPLE